MSGGHFDYKQYQISDIADSIDKLILDETRNPAYSQQTIEEFNRAVNLLRLASVYVQRIDWLVSGDDGEDSFHRRLQEELVELKTI